MLNYGNTLRAVTIARVGDEAVVGAIDGIVQRTMRFPAAEWEAATPEQRAFKVTAEWMRQDAEERNDQLRPGQIVQ